MFVFRIIAYIVGYLTLRVEGPNPERLVNQANQAGVPVWQVEAGRRLLRMRVPARNFRAMRHLARRSRTMVHIEDRHGLPFAARRVMRRQGLLVGAFLFLAGLYVLSSFIWTVEVTGVETLPPDVIVQAAAKLGLRPGVWKTSIDYDRVEKGIVLEVKEISWAGLEIYGTRAVLEVIEKTLPPPEPPATTPAHVVAAKGGLVTEVLALKGIPLVRRGQTVCPGQILVSGVIGLSAEEQLGLVKPETLPGGLPPATDLVHAMGIIRARCWYRGHGEALLSRQARRPTGRVVSRLLIKIGEQEIIVKGQGNLPFTDYDSTVVRRALPVWRNIRIPVEVTMTTFYEVNLVEETVSPEVAEQEARESAVLQAMSQIPPGVRLLNMVPKAVSDGAKVSVDVLIETLEDIGRTEPINP